MDIAALALALRPAALTIAQIKALDNSYLCQNPAIAFQQLKAIGHPVAVTTHTDGTAKYQVTA